MKWFIWLLLSFLVHPIVGQGYISTYWEVVKVYTFDKKELLRSEYIGVPMSLQTGGSKYTGFDAYVNLASFGNYALNATGQHTEDGYSIYMDDPFSGPRSYLLYSGTEIIYGAAFLNKIFVAIPCDYQTFTNKSVEIYKKMNPYPSSGTRSSYDRGSTTPSRKGSMCSFCGGTGVSPLSDYGPDYGGTHDSYYCETCKEYKRYHSHGKCPSCQGKGYN